MPDLERESLERGRDAGERGQHGGVTIALEDLGRAGGRLETERPTRAPLDVRSRGGIRADRPRQLAHTHSRERGVEPVAIALELEGPTDQLQPERRRFGM